jgi:hypothetical protein
LFSSSFWRPLGNMRPGRPALPPPSGNATAYLRNRYPQQIPGIKLTQTISAISILLCRDGGRITICWSAPIRGSAKLDPLLSADQRVSAPLRSADHYCPIRSDPLLKPLLKTAHCVS